MSAMNRYWEKAVCLAQAVQATQADAMKRAADAMANAVQNDGMIYTFGTGHSHLLAEEIFYRAGGLVRVCPIQDEPLMLHVSASRSSEMERMSGYAARLLADYRKIRPGDVLLLFSNSGRNALPLEMAQEAKRRGMTTVCITNLAHSQSVTSRHPSGLHLYEVCDIVIDNCGAIGDACIPIGEVVCGPTSTAIGAMILQAIVCETVEQCYRNGTPAEVFLSGNVDGGDAHNQAYIEKYTSIIKNL